MPRYSAETEDYDAEPEQPEKRPKKERTAEQEQPEQLAKQSE